MAQLIPWLDKAVGAAGNFVNKDIVHPVAQATQAAVRTGANVANGTSNVVGNTALRLPVISDAVKFGQQPLVKGQSPFIAAGNGLKTAAGVGYANSPLGAAERTAARTQATITQKPVHYMGVDTQQPVNQEVGNAAPIMGNKLLGQVVAGGLIAGDALYGKDVAHVGVKGAKVTGKAAVAANKAIGEDGYIGGKLGNDFQNKAANGKLIGDVTNPNHSLGYENSDAKMKINKKGVQALSTGQQIPLADLITHKTLAKDYKNVGLLDKNKGLKVVFNPKTEHAALDKKAGLIHLSPVNLKQLQTGGGKQAIMEEIQHAIDHTEGRISGTSPQYEAAHGASLRQADALNTLESTQPHVDAMNNLVQRGNITAEQFRNDPTVQSHMEAREIVSTLPKPTDHAPMKAYMENEGEIRAGKVADRVNMKQKELDADPTHAPATIARYEQPSVAARVDSKSTPTIAKNKFTESVKHSPEVSAEVRAEVSGQHVVRNTKQMMSDARQEIQTHGLPTATEGVLKDLAVENGKASDATLAKALEVAKAHDALGTEAGHSTATALYDQIAEHGVAKGQGVQILSQIARNSPAGLRNKAFKDLKKAGVTLTDDLKKTIQGHIDTITNLPDGKARDLAISVLQKEVAKHLPQSAVGQAISVWKAGLLSGVKTQAGNLVSNSTTAVLKKISDVPATLADQAMALGTGKRTKTLTMRGSASGTVEGAKNGWTTLKTGIDMRNIGDKYEQHAEINFGSKGWQKVLAAVPNGVFRGMNAADQPFWYSALKNSLYDQAKAYGINAGLSGKALRTHMDELVKNPTESMIEVSTKEANKATLGYDTLASKGLQAIHQGIDQFGGGSKTGKAIAHAAIDILAPFAKVPSAFLSRTIDFTPLGISKEVFSQVFHRIEDGKGFDQRQLAQAIGEGLTGTGVVALGMMLAQNDMLSGDYPKNDPKKAALWKSQKKIPNAIKINGNWISLNYLGQLGLLFNAGNKIIESRDNGSEVGDQAGAALAGLGQGLLGQSFLQGFSGFSNAIQDPARSAKTFVNSEAASLVPNALNDIRNITDPMQREANSVIDSIKNKLPGASKTLPVKIDNFGNELSQPTSGLDTALNPLKPSKENSTPLLNELDRLSQTDKTNAVFPLTVKSIGAGDSKIQLTLAQADERQKMLGAKLTPLWNQIIASPAYVKLDDAHKAQALQSALTDLQSAVDRQMTAKIDSSKLTKAATGNVARILSGNAPTSEDYLTKSANKQAGIPTTGGTPAQKYQIALAKFKTAQANGTISGAKAFATSQALGKEAITSKYPQAVQDFYNMSKSQQSAYLTSNPTDAKALYDQAQQLDAQLTANKFTTTKYKYGLGTKPKAAKKVSVAKTAKIPHYKAPSFKTPKLAKVKAPKMMAYKIPKTPTAKLASRKKLPNIA